MCKSAFFAQECQAQFFQTAGKRVELLAEEPEVFSAVLEFLYKGDYTPKLLYDKKTKSWSLDEDATEKRIENTVVHTNTGVPILKDTLIYVSLCASVKSRF